MEVSGKHHALVVEPRNEPSYSLDR